MRKKEMSFLRVKKLFKKIFKFKLKYHPK